MARIKICGLMRDEDIYAVNRVLPDYIGFVFAKSRRQVDGERAKAMKALLNPSIKAVGVFVNEEMDRIIQLCESGAIDLVQLHGDENGDYIKALKSRVPNRIIKAVRVRSPEDVKRAVEFSCDYLLLDTWHEQHYGGTGNVFDWSLVPKTIKPFFLAGGINSANIAQAIEKLSPYAVDVSSGVETDGYKDPAKILEIVSRARRIKELKT
ncbi:MAG: phosphoribosylanthranilate isomerase [Clostridiaceae bacterium]|jgi:phosphoribosylanthranilate isomerase|nr:phosphoribosylanthranilate isomerase [Bacillota bacterium]NLI38116.1 phosphoribosylanthranilate isomerase [Clostridiaceae bacterium]